MFPKGLKMKERSLFLFLTSDKCRIRFSVVWLNSYDKSINHFGSNEQLPSASCCLSVQETDDWTHFSSLRALFCFSQFSVPTPRWVSVLIIGPWWTRQITLSFCPAGLNKRSADTWAPAAAQMLACREVKGTPPNHTHTHTLPSCKHWLGCLPTLSNLRVERDKRASG